MTRPQEHLELWLHFVGEHSGIVDPYLTRQELVAVHEHEHDGPGTIRNHSRDARTFDLRKIAAVLAEAD